MAKFGFVDCISNSFDAFEILSATAEQKLAGTNFQRLTAPEILKVPVCVKKLLSQPEVEAAIIFMTVAPEDVDSLHLIMEKIIDIEVQHAKYAFYCVVSEEEYSTQKQFEKIVTARLGAILEVAAKALTSPSEVSSQVGSGFDFAAISSSVDFFSGESKDAPTLPTEGGAGEEQENNSNQEGDSRSLF